MEWNTEAIATLKNMAAKGCSSGVIAGEFGITRSAISGKAHRLGIRLGTSPDGQRRSRSTAAKSPHTGPRTIARPFVIPTLPALPMALRVVESEPINLTAHICTMDQLTSTTCRWPLWGHECPPEPTYCGCPTVDDKRAYCKAHNKRARQPDQRRYRG